jgi:hypothetical protein
MPLPIEHKDADRGFTHINTSYTYVGNDDFSDHITVDDVYNLFRQALFPGGAPMRQNFTLIISGEFFMPYEGHGLNEDVTTLSYPLHLFDAYEVLGRYWRNNPNASAVPFVNDLVKRHTYKGHTHEWFAVYRVSIPD